MWMGMNPNHNNNSSSNNRKSSKITIDAEVVAVAEEAVGMVKRNVEDAIVIEVVVEGL